MTGNIFLINPLKTRYILTLFLLIFTVSVLYLQSLKAPWVDECYSYYGVWHDNFTEFYDSMLTGINFSPPLYFLFNFCIQLVYPTSIEQLRLQSLVFIIIGIVFSFLLSRKIFGPSTALIATILVISQSHLLLLQAQEARHYAIFFACGAWVLYTQSFDDNAVKKYKWITFLAHLCLCQVHYLGIIFSLLSGAGCYFASPKRNGLKKYNPILLCWIISFVSYCFYLFKQKSILNTWPKPNGISDLLLGYNDSILILSALIPILIFITANKPNKDTKTDLIEENYYSRPIIITSVLWFSVPLMFWLLSHLSSLNLFVDRYFIPKESALIFLVAYGFSLIFEKLPRKKISMSISILGTFILSVVLVLVSTKRDAFGLNKDTNYHHSLIIEESYPTSKQPIMLEGDPKYFPNAYLSRNEYFLLVKDEDLIKTYNQFSRKIKLSGI